MHRQLIPEALALAVLATLLATACGRPAAEGEEAAASSTTPAAGEEDTVTTTREVVQRHLRTFGAGDLEGVLADYADNAVMFTPNGPVVGKAALRTAFEQLIAEFGQPDTTFELTQEYYDGEHGYINWTAETGTNVYEYGVDGFTVRGGQIVVQFFGAKITPKAP